MVLLDITTDEVGKPDSKIKPPLAITVGPLKYLRRTKLTRPLRVLSGCRRS